MRELLGRRSAAAAPTSGPVTVVPSQNADAEAATLHAETAVRPTDDPDAPLELPSRPSAADSKPAPPLAPGGGAGVSDDPLADYLDRMDEAFDRFEAGEPVASGPGRTVPEEPRPVEQDTSFSETDYDSLEGALSVLEGALDKLGLDSPDAKADDAPAARADPPSTPDAASPPSDGLVQEPVQAAGAPSTPEPALAPAPSAPQPSSEVAIEPTSLTETSRPVEAPGPPPESVSAPPSPEPEAPAPPPEPAAPVDTPPSLADAFASLLAAEQGNAGRTQAVYPWPRPASPSGMTEELIDRVAERVIARLSDSVTSDLVAGVVARVAEKLVREEIDRIKQS